MADQKAIVVAVRCRPMSLAERINDNEQAVVPTTNPRVIKIVGDGKDNDYTVDHTFWEEDTNEHVYGTVGKNTLDSAFAGYNGTIFAYGQTGSGKTHTMMGGDGENAGIIPRLCKDLFARIEAESIKAEVRCSYVEIYGQSEKLSDLLLPEGTTVAPTLAVRQRKSTEYFVEGLTAYQPESAVQMEMFIRAGSERRAVASTQMNDTSSRSHAVFKVELTQHIAGSRRTSSIKLVDLAGSENINKSGATGKRQMEAVSINKALSTLRRVLDTLAKESKVAAGSKKGGGAKKGGHIPFRDSVLTKLLADSMGGNCRTTMIAAVGPSSYNYAESKNTLQWACKARKIKCKAVLNEQNDVVKLKSLKTEVEELRAKLAALEAGARKGGGSPEDAKALKELRGTLAEREAALKKEIEESRRREEELTRVQAETRARLDDLKKEYDESQYNLGNARLAWKALVKNLRHEETQNKELTAEVVILKDKLSRYATIDDVEEREAVVARKEAAVGSIDEHERAIEALRAEYEAKVEVVRASELSVAERERAVSQRERAVEEREAFLLKRDSFYAAKNAGSGFQNTGRRVGSAGRRPGSGASSTSSTPSSRGRRGSSHHLDAPSLGAGGHRDGMGAVGAAVYMDSPASALGGGRGKLMGQHVMASMAGLALGGTAAPSGRDSRVTAAIVTPIGVGASTGARKGGSFRGGGARRMGAVR